MLVLKHYDFDLWYMPGKKEVVPNTLSRVYLNECEPEIPTKDMEAHSFLIKEELPINNNVLIRYCQPTATDKTL